MGNKQKVISIGLFVFLIGAFVFYQGYSNRTVQGAVEFSNPDCYASTTTSPTAYNRATSSQIYMTAGRATTTATCFLAGSVVSPVMVEAVLNGSSSATTIYNFFAEGSMDGQDWFPIPLGENASTTNPFNIGLNRGYYYAFSSSTIGGTGQGTGLNYLGADGTNNRNHVSFEVPVRMNYVRVYSALAAGSRNGSVWFRILPKSE